MVPFGKLVCVTFRLQEERYRWTKENDARIREVNNKSALPRLVTVCQQSSCLQFESLKLWGEGVQGREMWVVWNWRGAQFPEQVSWKQDPGAGGLRTSKDAPGSSERGLKDRRRPEMVTGREKENQRKMKFYQCRNGEISSWRLWRGTAKSHISVALVFLEHFWLWAVIILTI